MNYIFNADDFGRTHSVNMAIAEGFQNGYLDRTTIMVNMPFFEEAVRLSEKYNFKERVGLHINLTSGVPLTDEIKHLSNFCTDGHFNGQIFRSRKIQIYVPRDERRAIVEEIRAQVSRYRDYGFTLNHADSHGHVHTFPSILWTVITTLTYENIDSLRISANVNCRGLKKNYKAIANRSINMINKNKCRFFDAFSVVISNAEMLDSKNGICEIMLHPNYWDGDLQIGESLHYDDVRAFLTSKKEHENGKTKRNPNV